MRFGHELYDRRDAEAWSDEAQGRTAYPAVRRIMGPARDGYDDDDLEDVLEALFVGADPEDVENFMRGLQKFGKQAAPMVQKALPGMMQGAVQGGMVAGPWGALAGAALGGAGSLMAGGGPQQPAPTAPRPAAPAPAVQAAPAPLPGQAAVPAGAAGSAATAQLLALLSRPETMQALLSLLMAKSGRGTVQVGARQVPVGAFANAVSELAAQAAEAAGAYPGDGIADYLLNADGSPRCDVVNPAERAALLAADLALESAREAEEEATLDAEDLPVEWLRRPVLIEADDPLEGYEAAMEGRTSYGD